MGRKKPEVKVVGGGAFLVPGGGICLTKCTHTHTHTPFSAGPVLRLPPFLPGFGCPPNSFSFLSLPLWPLTRVCFSLLSFLSPLVSRCCLPGPANQTKPLRSLTSSTPRCLGHSRDWLIPNHSMSPLLSSVPPLWPASVALLFLLLLPGEPLGLLCKGLTSHVVVIGD